MRLKTFPNNQKSARRVLAKRRVPSPRKIRRKPAAQVSDSFPGPIQSSEKSTPASSVEEKAPPATSSPALLSPKPFDPSTEKTLTVKEAAYRLRKSEDAVYLWLRAGRLRGWQPGGRGCAILVSESSVQEALSHAMWKG